MSALGKGARAGLRVAPVLAVIAFALWVPYGCGEARVAQGTGAIEAGLFVETYVDLRMATLRAGVSQLPSADRDRILELHGVSEKDLLTFVEVHGRDAGFMHSIWDSIESRIDEERTDDAEGGVPPDPSSA